MATPSPSQAIQLYSLLRQIPGDLYNLDEKPLLGFPPAFNWNALAKELSTSLEIKELSIKPGEWQWHSKEDLFAGLGDKPKGISLTLSPIEGPLWWVMPEQELHTLMGLILAHQKPPSSHTVDPDFFKAFQRFLFLEVLQAYEKVQVDKKQTPLLSSDETLPSKHSLCLDITFHLATQAFHGRLYLSPEFRKSWSQRYIKEGKELILSSPIADTLDVIIHLEAGRVNLKRSEWKQLVLGDFLILDTCTIDPEENKARVMLVVQEMPLFRGKIKHGSLKILEHPLEHEVDTVMDNPTPHNDDELNLDDLEDENFDEPEESNAEKESEDLSDDEFDIDLDDIDLEETTPPAAAPSQPPTKPAAATAPTPQDQPKSKVPPPEKEVQHGIPSIPKSVDEVPLPIVIEVGRIQMSIKKLLELQPGNMLELDIHPEASVDLVLYGKRIAKGELLRIGDALGVRIIEIS